MPKNEIIIFLNRMRYLTGTDQMNGVRTFSFGPVKFFFCPAIDDALAYGLFGYLLDLCQNISAEKIPVATCVNAAAYMADNHIRYRSSFRWNENRGVIWNLVSAFHSRRLRRSILEMQAASEAIPGIAWVPTCEAALLETTNSIAPNTGATGETAS